MADDQQAFALSSDIHAGEWLQALFPFPGSQRVVECFGYLWRAQECPAEMALFGRTTAGYEQQVYLLTPAAAIFAAALPGCWTDAGDPTTLGWSLQVGRCDARPQFRLAHEMLRGRQ